jgi:hypothetical protein
LVWRTMHCPTTMLLFASAKEYLQRNSITEGTAAGKNN